eukprot:COSAG01_NODE_1_length_100484_cov_170.446142_58_plen_335_part_00
MKKKKLTYIIPAKAHEGLKIKFRGQKLGFESLGFRVYDVYLSDKQFIIFIFQTVFLLLTSPIAYVRYNPKALPLNLCLLCFSFFKEIVIEHNSQYADEYRLLKQPFPAFLDKFFLKCVALFPLRHATITSEIAQYLMCHGIASNKITVIQNGYLCASSLVPVALDLVEKIEVFISKYKRVGLFVGSGYSWHGVDKIVRFCEQFHIGLICIQPQQEFANHKDVLELGTQGYSVIKTITEKVSFGFGPFSYSEKKIFESASLKVREYLCHGLKVIKQERDTIEQISDLKNTWINIDQSTNEQIQAFLAEPIDKVQLAKLAKKHFAWESIFKNLFKD